MLAQMGSPEMSMSAKNVTKFPNFTGAPATCSSCVHYGRHQNGLPLAKSEVKSWVVLWLPCIIT